MPVRSARDDQRRLITRTLTDPVVFEELCVEIDRQWADQAWDYATLYDARALTEAVPLSILGRLSAYIDVVGGGRSRGPIGVVIPPRAAMLRSGIAYAAVVAGRTGEMEILLNEAQLDAWLARHTPRR
jgi:hypothetical protein